MHQFPSHFLPKCRCRMAKEQHWQRSHRHEGLPAILGLQNRASPPSLTACAPTLTPILYPVCRQPFTLVATLHPIRISFNTGTDLSLLLFPRAFERLLRLLGLLRLFSERCRELFSDGTLLPPKITNLPVHLWPQCDVMWWLISSFARTGKVWRLPFVS